MASRFHAIWLLSALALPQAGAPQQAPAPPATSAISGVVVDGATGTPVPNAVVYLSARSGVNIGSQPRQLADDKGRFAFVNLPADGSYTVTASKFGYLDGGYGRDTAPGDPLRSIQIKNNDWVGNLRVPVWKPGSISGTVRDENGEPVVGVFVRALVRYRMQGRDELAAGPMTVTDDRGTYRMSGLAPGRYIIQVPSVQASMSAGTPAPPAQVHDGVLEMDDTTRLVIGRYPLPPPTSNGRPMAYPIAFHAAASLVSEATTIDLTFGDDRPNVDVSLAPVPTARVSGVVEGPPEALALLTLRLLPAGLESLGNGSEAATALVSANGQFTFLNVPAGNYTIDAPARISEFVSTGGPPRRVSFPAPPGIGGWGNSSDAPDAVTGLQFTTSNFRGSNVNYSGRASVTVGGGEMAGVVVRVRPNGVMTGRLVIENDPAKPIPATSLRFLITLDPAGGEAYLGRPTGSSPQNAPTEFTVTNVLAGQYFLRAQGNTGWVVKSVSWKGRDYTDVPIDAAAADDLSGVVLTVTSAVPELSGSVRGVDDLKPEDGIVIVFPSDPSQWRKAGLWPARLKSTVVSTAGTYRVTNLPAGTYLVAAVDRSRRTSWNDPEFLAQVARTAAPVTLTWGGKISQDVPMTRIR